NIQPTSQPAAIVTITPTTSTICGAASIKVYPGQTLKIVSDGTNYQCPMQPGPPGGWQLLNTLTASSSATLSDTASFTSTYVEYRIDFENMLPVTGGGVIPQIQIHSGGAFQTTSYISTVAFAAASFTTSNPTTSIQLNNSSVVTGSNGFNGTI